MLLVWGLLLARSQNTLYLTDTNQMKEEAALLAYYYIALAFAALISSTFEFWFAHFDSIFFAHVSMANTMFLYAGEQPKWASAFPVGYAATFSNLFSEETSPSLIARRIRLGD